MSQRRPHDTDATLTTATVVSVVRATPHLVRVTLHSPDFANLDFQQPDQWVSLVFASADFEQFARAYTVTSVNAERCEITLDLMTHDGHGPGAAFARSAKSGDQVGLCRSEGTYGQRDSDTLRVLVADFTALPALGAILEQRPDVPTCAVASVPTRDDKLAIGISRGSSLDYVVAPCAAGGPELFAHVAAIEWFPAELEAMASGRSVVWLAGEAALVAALKRHFVALGVPERDIIDRVYWRAGATAEPAAGVAPIASA